MLHHLLPYASTRQNVSHTRRTPLCPLIIDIMWSLFVAADFILAKPEGRFSFLVTALKALRWPLLSLIPARFVVIAFNYAQPFLISRAISFVGDPVTSQTKNTGYGLIAATGIVYVGISVCLPSLNLEGATCWWTQASQCSVQSPALQGCNNV